MLSQVDGRALQAVEELKAYKMRVQEVEEELQKTERSYKAQVSRPRLRRATPPTAANRAALLMPHARCVHSSSRSPPTRRRLMTIG